MYVDGIDVVDFVVRLNKGFDFASLKDAASGGEGSRIMLALKVVLQNADPSQLLILMKLILVFLEMLLLKLD